MTVEVGKRGMHNLKKKQILNVLNNFKKYITRAKRFKILIKTELIKRIKKYLYSVWKSLTMN